MMAGRVVRTNLVKNPELERLMEAARNHKMTPEERREQRISWVYGNLPHDSTQTKEQVRAAIEAMGL